MITEEEYLKAVEVVKAYQKQVNEQVSICVAKELLISKDKVTMSDLKLRSRSMNAIRYNKNVHGLNIDLDELRKTKVVDIIDLISENEILSQWNAGKNTIKEIKEKLSKYGFVLKQHK